MYEEYLIRLLLAALVGAFIGLEREYHDKTAGLRTMILIAVGSCLFTILSMEIGSGVNPNDFAIPVEADLARIAAAIVSGVGFLGAGAIIKDGLNVRGLTTAASIWLVSSLGMGIGIGEFALVFSLTGFVMLVLCLLPFLERKVDAMHEFLEFCVTIKNTDKQEDKLLEIFAEEGVRVVNVHRAKHKASERQLRIMAKTNPAKHDKLARRLATDKSVLEFKS